MRRNSLILAACLLAAVALAFGATVRAQTPLTSLAAGGLFDNGSNTHFLVKGDFRQNLKTWKTEQQDTKLQTYLRAGFLRSNDISLNPVVSQKLQGIDAVLMTEYHIGDFFFGIGWGRAWELEDTVTIEVPVYAAVLGWQALKEVRLYAGCDYYSRAKYLSNVVGVYGGIAFDLKELVE